MFVGHRPSLHTPQVISKLLDFEGKRALQRMGSMTSVLITLIRIISFNSKRNYPYDRIT